MPNGITGTEVILATAMKAKIKQKLEAAIGEETLEPTYIQALCEGIAESLIPHLVANVKVNPGQDVPADGILDSTSAPCTGSASTGDNGSIL